MTATPTPNPNKDAIAEARELLEAFRRVCVNRTPGPGFEQTLEAIQALLTQQRTAAEQAGYERGAREVQSKLAKLYYETETQTPPSHALVSLAEREWNRGLYQGQLKALEMVTQSLLGIDGDTLAALQPPQSGGKL